MNSVHPHHNSASFLKRRRHFIFTFHDSTFECIAEGYTIELVKGTFAAVADRMHSLLIEGWRGH